MFQVIIFSILLNYQKKIFITIGNLFYIKTIIYQAFIYLYLFYFTLQFKIYWILLNSLFLNDLYIVYDLIKQLSVNFKSCIDNDSVINIYPEQLINAILVFLVNFSRIQELFLC